MRRARTSFPDVGRLGRTPKRAGRLGSYTSGSVLRFTISCGHASSCKLRPHSPHAHCGHTPHTRTAASGAGG